MSPLDVSAKCGLVASLKELVTLWTSLKLVPSDEMMPRLTYISLLPFWLLLYATNRSPSEWPMSRGFSESNDSKDTKSGGAHAVCPLDTSQSAGPTLDKSSAES